LIAMGLEEEAARRGARRIQNSFLEADSAARRLLESLGYRAVRVFREMRIELEAAPPAPEWPDGLRVVPFNPSASGTRSSPGLSVRATRMAAASSARSSRVARVTSAPGWCQRSADGANARLGQSVGSKRSLPRLSFDWQARLLGVMD
jgi:hypothetical protein